MRGTRWPDHKVAEALESFALSGNISATSRETSVPKATVARWVKQNGHKVDELKARNDEVRRQALEESLEDMARRHCALGQKMQQEGEELLAKIRRPTAGAVATLIARGVDIERLAHGEATAKTEMTVWDRIDRLVKALEEEEEDGPATER